MRCSAAAFLTNPTGCGDGGIGGSAAAPFSPAAASSRSMDGGRYTSHYDYAQGSGLFFTSRKQVNEGGDGAFLPLQGREFAFQSHGKARRSSHAPRPVTIRQLYASALNMLPLAASSAACCTIDEKPIRGVAEARLAQTASVARVKDGCQNTESTPGADALPASSRIGESTILLDGVACHTVVVCGRVVRCEAAEAAGTQLSQRSRPNACVACPSAPPPLYDVLWITDNTGVLCVLRPRSSCNQSQRMHDLTFARLLGGFGVSEVTPALEGARAVLDAGACYRGTHDIAGTSATTALRHPLRAQWLTSLSSTSTHIAESAEAYSSGAADGAEEEEEEVVFLNDYVVCTGVLAFTDVDLLAASMLRHDAAELRAATVAAVASTSQCEDVSEAVKARDADTMREDTPYVLLPGTEVPLRLDSVKEELGLVGPLPLQTRYLTEREAQQWTSAGGGGGADGGGAAEAAACCKEATSEQASDASTTKSCFIPPVHRDNGRQGGADPSTALFPLVCLKGYPRLVLDSNECLFWWLSAIETHLRLTAQPKR